MSNESFDTTLKKYLYIITDVLENIYVEYFQIWIIYYKYSRQKVDYPSVVVILWKKLAAEPECSSWQNRIFSQSVADTKTGQEIQIVVHTFILNYCCHFLDWKLFWVDSLKKNSFDAYIF